MVQRDRQSPRLLVREVDVLKDQLHDMYYKDINDRNEDDLAPSQEGVTWEVMDD